MNTPRKRIVISGWYGNSNLGDEAILAAVLTMIRRVLLNAEITVFSDSPEETSLRYQVLSVGRRGWSSRLRRMGALLGADLFILGGGELLYDSGSGGEAVHWLKEVILAKLMCTPSMYFNGGVGLVYRRISKYYIRRVCRAMELIAVRDDVSRDNLRALGIAGPIHVGADSVFALAREPLAVPRPKGDQPQTWESRPTAGVNVRPWLYRLEEVPPGSRELCREFGGSSSEFRDFIKSIARAVDALRNREELDITLFPISFFRGSDNEYDVDLLEEIAHLLSDRDGVTVIGDECTFHDMLDQVRRFAIVIGVRLHALVFAALSNTPMLAINYDPKIAAFMKQLGQEEYLMDADEVTEERLSQRVGLLWENRRSIRAQLRERIPELADRAESSVEEMARLLTFRKARVRLFFEGIFLVISVIPTVPYRCLQRMLRKVRRLWDLPFAIILSRIIQRIGSGRRCSGAALESAPNRGHRKAQEGKN